jgi:hypothetical protein
MLAIATMSQAAGAATISGSITPSGSGVGTLITVITVTGTQVATATAGASGTYTVPGLPDGNYVVAPTKSGYAFTPPSRSVTISGADVPNVSFTTAPVPTYNVSGSVTATGAGAVLTLSGSPSVTVVARASGDFNIENLPPGSYTLTPRRTGFTFNPVSQPITIVGADISGVSFTATASPPQTLSLPDLSDIIPGSGISIVGTGSAREFQYTHRAFNGGPGPLVIQPQYSPTSGNYQGTQYLYRRDGNAWTIAQQVPIAGAFVFHAAHGHFHYPFGSFGLYDVAPTGGVGNPVALSTKIGFCIADSYLFDPYLPNAGDIGGLGTCSDPLSLRGLDIGAVDEYDRTDDGQSIAIGNLPDGTYWLRAFVDPDNFITEADESNNETDVRIRITGTDVQVLETVIPVLPPLPAITLDAPVNQAVVLGTVNLVASTPVTTGVQFLLDGLPLGGLVPTAPYSLPWNSWTVPDGIHWLAAKTTDANGRTNTSAIATVTVANSAVQDTIPPTVIVSDPDEGEIVSSIVPLGAIVQDNSIVTSVRFYVDGLAVGDPITTPPYLVYWKTLTEADGPHTVTATATDAAGLTGTSAPVGIIVDNSHPPDLITQDVQISVDGAGIMETPPFSTATDNDLLVAFVSYDGPPAGGQIATVSGAGFTWQLLKRSNAQLGTSEIWAARVNGKLTNATVLSQPGVGTFHGSLTVIAFTHAAGPGVVGQASAPSGPPDVFLPGVAVGSWVYAVGNDWDRATPRTPVSGQVIVHERVDTPVGDTFWVQSTAAPSTAFGLVTIHDNAPTNDQWNYTAVEVVATRLSDSVGVAPNVVAQTRRGLQVMTNPTSGAIHLTAHGLSDGDRDLWLVDITGRRVASLERGIRLANGRGEAVWDVAHGARGITPGVYLVALAARGGEIEATARVVLLK